MLADNSIDPRAKFLYMSIIAFKPKSIRELADRTGMNRSVVTNLIGSLQEAQWLLIYETPGKKVMIPTGPLEVQKAKLEHAKEVDKFHPRGGENKMNLLLDLIVDVSPFIYNCRPWFLQNPFTKEFLEYDCFAPDVKVPWEFNGRQHYETTPQFSDEIELERTKERDFMKAQISCEQGVTLITITSKDLKIDTMLEKVPEHVPTKLFDVNSVYAKGVEEMCLQYIKYSERARARDMRFQNR